MRGSMFPDGLPYDGFDPGRGVKIAEGIYASKPFPPNLTAALKFSEGCSGLSSYWGAKCPCCDGEIRVMHFYTHYSPKSGGSCMTKADISFQHREGADECEFRKRMPHGKVELIEDVEYVSNLNGPPWNYFRGLNEVLEKTLKAHVKRNV